jgi:hypothetical protein
VGGWGLGAGGGLMRARVEGCLCCRGIYIKKKALGYSQYHLCGSEELFTLHHEII